MPKLSIKAGATSETVDIFLQDSTSTTGAGKGGQSSSTLTAYYNFPRGASTAITLSTLASPTAAYSGGGIVAIDGTNQLGKYRFDIPDACLVGSSGRYCNIMITGTAIVPCLLEIELTGWDNQLSISSQENSPASIATAIWQDTTSGDFTVTGSIGKLLETNIDATISSRLISGNVTVGGYAGGEDPATLVLGATASSWNTSGTIGHLINASGSASDPWSVTLPGSYTAGTAGYILGTNLDTTISSRAVSTAIHSGTAQSGNSSSIKLDSGASSTNNIYKGNLITIISGTGAGQTRTITSYNGSNKTANTDWNWLTAPNNTSVFNILAADNPSLNQNLQVTANVSQAIIRSGTAQSGGTNTITLDSGASSTDNIYFTDLINIISGTGAGQSRTIVSYNGTTKIATVNYDWIVNPDNTSVFNILASISPGEFSDQGVAQAATSSTITLQSTASSTDNIYSGSLLTILSGTDSGDTVEITAYNGTTKVATVTPNFAITPDTTSSYAVIPTSSASGGSSTSVNVSTINGIVPLLDTTGNFYSRLCDGVTHGGTSAILSLEKIIVNNTSGDAVTLQSSTGDALKLVASSGYGIDGTISPQFLACFFSTNSGVTYSSAVSGSVVHEIVVNASSSGTDTPGTTTLLSRLTSTRATYLDNLNSGVPLELTQAIPTSNTANTIADCLNGARVQAFGKWSLDTLNKILYLYNYDGSQAFAFNIDNLISPTSRVPR